MRAYWDNLNQHEQWLVGITVLLGALCLGYWLFIASLLNAVDSNRQMLKEKKQTLQWMQNLQGHPLNARRQQINHQQLLTLISNNLAQDKTLNGFTKQLQQSSQGEIQVSFEQVPYLPFLAWLWQLTENYTVSIKQLILEKTAVEGVVKISLTLT